MDKSPTEYATALRVLMEDVQNKETRSAFEAVIQYLLTLQIRTEAEPQDVRETAVYRVGYADGVRAERARAADIVRRIVDGTDEHLRLPTG